MLSHATKLIAAYALFTGSTALFAAEPACSASSGDKITPVIELYTSEGCSSCPPADKWASSLKNSGAVVQAFHVGYWDYIGWVDRFANPAHTTRQRQVASSNNLRSIYTPQVVHNGRDWPGWHQAGGQLPTKREAAHVFIRLQQLGADHFEATVTADDQAPAVWSAYWTVTENSHSSKVRSGENAGELLQHDHVVRQYTPAGDYRNVSGTPQRLVLRSVSSQAGHARMVNLVVFDSKTGRSLQAVSAGC